MNGEPTLDESDVDSSPFAQFHRWFDEAVAAGVPEPNAMCLCTSTVAGSPSARMVLLKAVDLRGFVFYTNYESAKSTDMTENPAVALVWRWHALARQVRVAGAASRVEEAESDSYFSTRDRGAQLGAWASPQSRVLADRAELDHRLAQVTARFDGGPVPRPPWWGGVRVAPDSVEFWQGRPSRLHDRLRYVRRAGHPGWRVERLAP